MPEDRLEYYSKPYNGDLHYSENCGFKMVERFFDGVYKHFVLLRECHCRFQNQKDVTHLEEYPRIYYRKKGVDLHGNKECNYKTVLKFYRYENGKVKLRFYLKLHCYCSKRRFSFKR